ncbi:MAG: SAM-dependent methyltransferase [Pseudobdellovibrionaceae bacterium]
MKKNQSTTTHTHGYWIHSDRAEDFAAEVKLRKLSQIQQTISLKDHQLVICEGEFFQSWWAQESFPNLQSFSFTSVKNASTQLKEISKYWLPVPVQLHRKQALIQSQLSKTPSKVLTRGQAMPDLVSRSYWLSSENEITTSEDCALPYPAGTLKIEPDTEAPSRAYAKLDEALARFRHSPTKEDTVIDLGSCPGGWSWVLSHLAGQVISVDTAPLDPKMSKRKNVQFLKKDAFALDPRLFPQVTWLVSDIICYPDKFFELVQKWRSYNTVQNFVCTLKFKGKTDFSAIQAFAKIPRSQIFHLNSNKHELTWVHRSSELDKPPHS